MKTSGLSLALEVSTSDAYGPSTASVLIMALTEHRDFSLRAVMSELKNRDFKEAFLAYSDYRDCLDMLDTLLRSAVALSRENYVAPTYGKQPTAEEVAKRKKGDYEEFLAEFSLVDPDAE